MAIKASCGNCKSSFNAKDSLAGRKVKCPKCGEKLRVPGEKTVASPAKAKKKKKAMTHLAQESLTYALPPDDIVEVPKVSINVNQNSH